MTQLFGIKNCDSVKKARKWLQEHNIPYQFHDVRQDGLDETHISQWMKHCDWQQLVNKRSTTWKQLDPAIRENLTEHNVSATLLEHPTLIKRPVLVTKQASKSGSSLRCMIGFNSDDYSNVFS